MSSGIGEPLEGLEKLGTADKDNGKGGRKLKGAGDVFYDSFFGGTSLQVGDVGDDPPHGLVPGMVSTQGSQTDLWDTTKESGGWELGIPTYEDGNT